jgi:hypothetical protein
MEEKPPDEWQRLFASSGRGRSLAMTIGTESPTAGDISASRPAVRLRTSPVRQWSVLSSRYVSLLMADKSNLALLLVQPLAITTLISLVCRELPTIMFLLVVSALWFGCSNAAQQIVKERAVYRRERMVNLRLDAYLASKVVLLATIGGLQSALMLALVCIFEAYEGSLLIHFVALFLATVNGVALGLIISALASNADRAMSVVPLSLIPQIILAGVLVALPDMNGPTRAISCAVASRWANQVVEIGLFEGLSINADLLSEPSHLRPLKNLYPDYDLFQPGPRLRFLADYGGKVVAKKSLLVGDVTVLCGFIVVQLALAAGVLKSQDTI